MNAPYITCNNRAFSRRTMLKGIGISLALPMLDAMYPVFARNTKPAPPKRFVGIMTNMGIMPQFFFPEEKGHNYTSTPYLDILKVHRKRMTIFSGVSLPGVDGGHASEKCFLTGAPGIGQGSFKNSISLDQVMAETLGGDTRFPSLTLMIGPESLSCSWTRSGSMIPPEKDPIKLYQKLFIEDTEKEKAAAARRLKEDRSLLDTLREQAKRLERTLGSSDRERLDQYLTSVRDLEQRLAKATAWIDHPKPKVSTPQPKKINDHHNLPQYERVMFDLIRLALETDSTRIVTMCLNAGSLTPRQIPGVRSTCHELSHHGGREEKVKELRSIEEAQFNALNGLSTVQEHNDTLLNHTSVLYGSNMGSANSLNE